MLLRSISQDSSYEHMLLRELGAEIASASNGDDDCSPLSSRLHGSDDFQISWCDGPCPERSENLPRRLETENEPIRKITGDCPAQEIDCDDYQGPECTWWDGNVASTFVLERQLFASRLLLSYHGDTLRVMIHEGMSSAEIRSVIASAVPDLCIANLRLREPVNGCICPISAASLLHFSHSQKPFVVEEAAAEMGQSEGNIGCIASGNQGLTAQADVAESAAPSADLMSWVQEPPHSGCEWLSLKAGSASSMPHCFNPAPAVALPVGVDLAALDASSCLKVSLWTASYEDVSQHLSVGMPTLQFDQARKRVVASWPAMSISEIPANVAGGTQAVRVGRAHAGGRGANGWFHLQVELRSGLPGCLTVPPLVLRESSGAPAKILIKHQRCKSTGRWKERMVGPYADHTACALAGSHVSGCGRRLCRECA